MRLVTIDLNEARTAIELATDVTYNLFKGDPRRSIKALAIISSAVIVAASILGAHSFDRYQISASSSSVWRLNTRTGELEAGSLLAPVANSSTGDPLDSLEAASRGIEIHCFNRVAPSR